MGPIISDDLIIFCFRFVVVLFVFDFRLREDIEGPVGDQGHSPGSRSSKVAHSRHLSQSPFLFPFRSFSEKCPPH